MSDVDLPKVVYRLGVVKLREKHDEMERHIHAAMEMTDEFKEFVDQFEEACVWQARFEALLMAVRDVARDNRELQSVADEVCRDVPPDGMMFGLHRAT